MLSLLREIWANVKQPTCSNCNTPLVHNFCWECD